MNKAGYVFGVGGIVVGVGMLALTAATGGLALVVGGAIAVVGSGGSLLAESVWRPEKLDKIKENDLDEMNEF